VTPSGVDVSTTSGTDAVPRYLEELCVVTRADEAGLPLVPAALARAGGGTLVVISTAISADDRAALVGMRPRYADVVVVAMDGSAPVVPGVRVLGAMDAVDAIRQWQTVIA
jgi:hypothetical protein